MAEHVVTVNLPANEPTGRLTVALADRLGNGEQIRSPQLRDAQAAFKLYVATRTRGTVISVERHVCRHDEGIGDCRGAPGEEA